MNRPMILIFLLAMMLQFNFTRTYAQQTGEFSISVGDQQVDVVLLDPEGREIFGVIVQKNGGISELRISQIPYATSLGFFVWNDDWGQSYGSDAIAEPVIENKGDYVTLTCYGMFRVHQLSIVTNITISKTGIILFSSRMVAERNEPTIMMIAWDSFPPIELFAGEKVYIRAGGRVQEATLPVNFGTNPIFSSSDVQWVDFSKPLEGVTLINMAPDLHSEGIVQDEREWNGTTYSARYTIRAWGQSSMAEGEEANTKVAIYIHGSGGYEGNLEVIDLLLSFTDLEARIRSSTSFKNDRARELASQARVQMNTALVKLLTGDINGATDTLKQAESLIKQAEETEVGPIMMRDILVTGLIVILIAISIVVLKIFRKRKTGK
ncbi:MAG: hypothetical protein QW797_04190 [Thermoproteota archaeon]